MIEDPRAGALIVLPCEARAAAATAKLCNLGGSEYLRLPAGIATVLGMDRIRTGISVGVTALLVVAAAPAIAKQEAGPQEPPAFRSEVQVVSHSVAVVDREGEPVQGLGLADFTVYEDDERQEISVFLSPDDSPLDVALVIDSSASLFHYARPVRLAAKSFLGQLEPLDCVYLLPFNDEIGPGTWDRGLLLRNKMDGIFMRGGTALYDALIHGIDVLNRTAETVPSRTGCGEAITMSEPGRPDRRRAVVLLTDGADQNSQGRYDQVLDLARDSAIPVFPVVNGEARNDDRLRLILSRLAAETGGTVVDAARPEQLPKAFADVVVMLRASYLIGYLPPDGDNGQREHAVRVRSRPGYRLVHRPTYWR